MIYYVTHPNIDFSATVEAPSTEKARTTFLDYLERTGRLSRSRRQTMRLNMVTERVHDPTEVQSDVHLQYTYDGAGGIQPMAQITVNEPGTEVVQEINQPVETTPQPMAQPATQVSQPVAQTEVETPIMRASRNVSALTESPIARQAKESAINVGV